MSRIALADIVPSLFITPSTCTESLVCMPESGVDVVASVEIVVDASVRTAYCEPDPVVRVNESVPTTDALPVQVVAPVVVASDEGEVEEVVTWTFGIVGMNGLMVVGAVVVVVGVTAAGGTCVCIVDEGVVMEDEASVEPAVPYGVVVQSRTMVASAVQAPSAATMPETPTKSPARMADISPVVFVEGEKTTLVLCVRIVHVPPQLSIVMVFAPLSRTTPRTRIPPVVSTSTTIGAGVVPAGGYDNIIGVVVCADARSSTSAKDASAPITIANDTATMLSLMIRVIGF